MKKYFIFLLSIFFITISTSLFSQNKVPLRPNAHWVGKYKSARISYGRIYQLPSSDSTKTGGVPYMGGIYFWVGAKVYGNEKRVSSGDGNLTTGRPEWGPLRWKILEAPVMEMDAIEEITLSEYNDRKEFNGHNPLGLLIRQTVYSFEGKPYQIFNFEVTNLGDNGDLTGVYIGVVGHFLIPDLKQKRIIMQNDLIKFIGPQKNPVIVQNADKSSSDAPFIGLIPLNDTKAKLNYWKMEKQYIYDEEKYDLLACLSGENKKELSASGIKDADEPGIYNFLWSSGPYNMPKFTIANFSVSLIQQDGDDNYVKARKSTNDVFTDNIKSRHSLSALSKEAAVKIPEEFALKQNYPNPFNPTTTIEFALPTNQFVTLRIYNILGQSVRTLINMNYPAGEHSVIWDGRDDNGLPVSSGIYIYQIQAGLYVWRNKMVLLK